MRDVSKKLFKHSETSGRRMLSKILNTVKTEDSTSLKILHIQSWVRELVGSNLCKQRNEKNLAKMSKGREKSNSSQKGTKNSKSNVKC